MSTTTAGPGRIGWALADSWTMTRRELAHWARQPVQVVVGLVFPVMLLLMFNYLVGGGRGSKGTTRSSWCPGCSRSPWPSGWRARCWPSPRT